jgi:glutathione peroxidase
MTAYAFRFQHLRAAERLGFATTPAGPVLVVDTASLCGYTPQYAGLEEIRVKTAIGRELAAT